MSACIMESSQFLLISKLMLTLFLFCQILAILGFFYSISKILPSRFLIYGQGIRGTNHIMIYHSKIF